MLELSGLSLYKDRGYYKPFQFPQFFQAYELQSKMHWIPAEVPLHEDVRDWNQRLTEQEKHLLTQLFRFFTQMDTDVAGAYIDSYLPVFKPPEIRMMLTTFSAMEAIHQHAYSLLLDTVGMPELEYKAFQEFEDMKAKSEYLDNIAMETPKDIAKSIAIVSAFGEGLQLFSSFAMLLNFPRQNKMKGMGQIVSWSLRDEDLHVQSLIQLFHEVLNESPEIWTTDLKRDIYQACRDMVELEDKFIDLCYEMGNVEGLSKLEVKEYIRYTADKRLLQLGLKSNYGVKDNPLPWLDWMMAGEEHANFFEQRASAYSKISLQGSWVDVWSEFDVK